MRVLFVCVENANRSQMAEAFARIHGGDGIEAYSAGSRPSGVVNPKAIASMAELDYDLTAHHSTSLDDLPDVEFDLVATMGCGDACPHVRARHRVDWAIPDPKHMDSDEFRTVRDLIGDKVRAALEAEMSDDYIEANRRMWNEAAGVHADAYVTSLLERIASPEYTTFDDVERRIFERIDLAGKDVAQLNCNNGRELISVKRAGAGRCVGFDISDRFIEQAQSLAAAAGADVHFERTNVYEIGAEYDGSFDLVYVTIGVLGWLRDLGAFFDVVDRLVRPGGQLFLYEMHPILDMYDGDKGLEVQSSYFRTEPFVDENETDYMDPTRVVESVSYWFHHKLSDVIGGIIDRRFRLEHFEEHDHDISKVFESFQELEHRPPLSYSLLARKC